MPNDREYALGDSAHETRRLTLQHALYAPVTRRLLTEAGLGPGMRVLDVGSGAGDVAMLAAEIVGPGGSVVGCDVNPAIVATARARAAEAGLGNVAFVVGDERAVGAGATFDAAIGRFILMHVADPVGFVRAVASHVRDGGIVAFEEMDDTYPPTTFPPTDLSRQLARWLRSPAGAGLADARIGSKLFGVFVEAGLPEPRLTLEAPIGGGRDWAGYAWYGELIRSLLPVLRQRAGVDPATLDVDTLADRLRDEVVANRGALMLPVHIGAWARKRPA